MRNPSVRRSNAHPRPEDLGRMTTAELRDALESALDSMGEDGYDNSVVSAYLDELNRREPVPQHPSAQESYDAFKQKLSAIIPDSGGGRSPFRARRAGARRILRNGLVAAVIVAVCLLVGVMAAQAAGVDILGTLARWTDSVFTFGEIYEPESGPSGEPGLSSTAIDTIESYLPNVPPEFTAGEPFVSIDSQNGDIEYSILYTGGNNRIQFKAVYRDIFHSIQYEKDVENVELYDLGNSDCYIFQNNGSYIAAWQIDNFEYSISTDIGINELKEIIDFYIREAQL